VPRKNAIRKANLACGDLVRNIAARLAEAKSPQMQKDLSLSAIVAMATLRALEKAIKTHTELLDWSVSRSKSELEWIEQMQPSLTADHGRAFQLLADLQARVTRGTMTISLLQDDARHLVIVAAQCSLDQLAAVLRLASLPAPKRYSRNALRELGAFLGDVGAELTGLGVVKHAYDHIRKILTQRSEGPRMADEELLHELERRELMCEAGIGLEAYSEGLRRLLAAARGGNPVSEVTRDVATALFRTQMDDAEAELVSSKIP